MWDMSIYFPEGIESQFGFSAGSSYGFRDQEPNHFGKKIKNWGLVFIRRESTTIADKAEGGSRL